jgi:hypothetical protein
MNKKEVGRKVEVPELAGLPGCYLHLYIRSIWEESESFSDVLFHSKTFMRSDIFA